jgi:transformer-2 protein
VFGLSLETGTRELRDVFGQYGPIEDIQIVYDYHSGRSRGFAFIYMKNIDDAIEAKESAPGTEIDGRKIRVDYSTTEHSHTPAAGKNYGARRAHDRRSSPGYRDSGGRSRSYSR